MWFMSLLAHKRLHLHQFFTQVQMEDYDLCEKTQRNLNAGIYETGICEFVLPMSCFILS